MNIKNFILNNKWTLEMFDNLNLSQFKDDEIELFMLCKKLVQENKEISALNILKDGNKELLLFYISLCNEIDNEKLKKEYRCKKKTKK